jgi:hypothetical protein
MNVFRYRTTLLCLSFPLLTYLASLKPEAGISPFPTNLVAFLT